MQKVKFSIIIPVYNEAKTVESLIRQVLEENVPEIEKEIIIVESCSNDGSREIVDKFQFVPGVKIVHQEIAKGKGAAVKEGLSHVSGDIVLIQDADLEYRTSDYKTVLKPILTGNVEIVFGSRTLTHPYRWRCREYKGLEKIYGWLVNFGGVLLTLLFNILYGVHLSDGATMYKVFKSYLLKNLNLKSNRFDYDWEITAKLVRKGCKIVEVPVWYRARSKSEGKKILFFIDGWKVLKAIIKYRFVSLK